MHIKLFVIVFGNLISATIGLWPLIVYTSPLIIDKPSNTDCATLECEAKKNTEVYKRVDNHNEAQQCYSYTECLNKAVEFIGSENFTLRDEVPKINLTRDELLATVIYTTNLFSDFNWRSRNVAGNSSLDHTDAKGLNPYRIFYHTLLSASRKIEQFYKGPSKYEFNYAN